MFVPVEPALHLALQEDPSLYGDAFDKNVVLVSSSTLLVALRAVESVWRHQKQTENAQEIARQAGNLHDAFILFTQSLEEVGSRLDQAKAAYDLSLSRLATGRGNLVKRTLELQKLGARGDKQLPPNIARLAEE
jgi:DNA recombination protein RmuC